MHFKYKKSKSNLLKQNLKIQAIVKLFSQNQITKLKNSMPRLSASYFFLFFSSLRTPCSLFSLIHHDWLGNEKGEGSQGTLSTNGIVMTPSRLYNQTEKNNLLMSLNTVRKNEINKKKRMRRVESK